MKAIKQMIILGVSMISWVINFNAALQGGPGNLVECIASLVYIAVWIVVTIGGVRSHNKKTLLFVGILWLMIGMTALGAIAVNILDVEWGWITMLTAILLTPLHGITYFLESQGMVLGVIAATALSLGIFAFYQLRGVNSDEK